MCGIVGYIGTNQAAPILLDGLSKLEYRGYDSAGLAVRDADADIEIVKTTGRLKSLLEKTNDGVSLRGELGIGHTRWATHGQATVSNAHPHYSDDAKVVLVHNGIIENHNELREKLLKKGYTFYSNTDTEVLVKLIDYYYNKYKKGAIDAIARVMMRVEGSYATAVMFKDVPDEIYVARKESPLIVGIKEDECFIASDVSALLKYTRNVYYMDNQELACLKKGEITFYNIDREKIDKELHHISWDVKEAEKDGFEHFMLKEIHEQPKAVQDTIDAYLKDGGIDLSSISLAEEDIRNISSLCIIACGSAYHVGMSAQFVFEDMLAMPTRVEFASEFRNKRCLLDKDSLVVVISQSGETADTLASLRYVKSLGYRSLAVVNVIGSSIAREADSVLYTMAGPEVAVATTKAYNAQLVAMYMLAMKFAQVREAIDTDVYKTMMSELKLLPDKISRLIEDKERIQWFAHKFAHINSIFFMGRGQDYNIAMEASLKMKEINYVHSEAYAAGELKHGAMSLIDESSLAIGILTQENLYDKTISNMQEVKSRGAYLTGITNYGHYLIEDIVDFTVYIPHTHKYFTTSLAIVPMQLLSYYIGVAKGLDVDRPRNLAKSVTVE